MAVCRLGLEPRRGAHRLLIGGFVGFPLSLFMNYHLAEYFEQIEHKEKQTCRAYRSVRPSRYEMKVRWVIGGYSRKGNRRMKIAPL